jgi:hypothetical protein
VSPDGDDYCAGEQDGNRPLSLRVIRALAQERASNRGEQQKDMEWRRVTSIRRNEYVPKRMLVNCHANRRPAVSIKTEAP